jgi:hypothetical protein
LLALRKSIGKLFLLHPPVQGPQGHPANRGNLGQRVSIAGQNANLIGRNVDGRPTGWARFCSFSGGFWHDYFLKDADMTDRTQISPPLPGKW